MSKCYKYTDEKYEVFVENSVFIKDKEKNVYLKSELKNLPKSIQESLNEYTPKVTVIKFASIITFFIFLLFINVILLNHSDTKIQSISANLHLAYIFLFFYLSLNIFIHELGHIKSLNYIGEKHQKIGFKMNYYIFPAIYVEMNEIYLISKNEKIIVHLAGLITNYLTINFIQVINLLFLKNKILDSSFIFFSYALLWNLVPVLNSDGYKVLNTLFSVDELENKRKNHLIVKLIQAISLLLVIETVISWFV